MAMPLPMAERLQEFYRRLAGEPLARSAGEALSQMSQRLDEVEDDLSGIPKKSPPPAREQSDGRMYPPQRDSIRRAADGSITARTRGHRIAIGSDGSIVIINLTTGETEFTKPGALT